MRRIILFFSMIALLQVSTPLFCVDQYIYPYPVLSLTGKAQIYKPADEFVLKIGVVTTKDTAQKALADNSKKIDKIIDALNSIGLAEGEYQTGRFSIQPTYTPYPKDPPPQWVATINGYQVTNTLVIQSTKLDLIGQFIDAAATFGATTVEELRFTLSDPEEFSHEAIEKATNSAMNKANTMAKAAHVNLGRLVSISLDEPGNANFSPVSFAKSMDINSIPTIEPGNVSLSATVRLVYEISGDGT